MNYEDKLKKWTLSKWKKEAWKYCSIYNRLKDTDRKGYGNCITCGKSLFWKDGDAGHFISGRHNSILFYDKGIHLQCKFCNRNQGEQYLYSIAIKNRYGEEELDHQLQLRYQNFKYTKEDYLELIKEYTKKIKKLLKNKTIYLKM